MSELADRACRLVEGFNRGEDLVALGVIDEEFEYVNPPDAMEPGTRRGPTAWPDALRSMGDSYDELRVEVDEVRDVGSDRVLMLARFLVRGRESGVAMETEQSYLWTFRDGRAVRLQWFWGHEAGLAAAGLDA